MTDPTIAAAVADTITEIAAEAAAAPAVVPAAEPATPAAEPHADAVAAAATAAAETPAKPTRSERHVANLTRKAADETRAREAAERRAEAAEALLAASRTEDPEKPAPPSPRPVTRATDPEVRAAAAQLLAEEKATETRQKVIDAGVKQFGKEDWDNRAETLQTFGATANSGFMEALLEAENPTAIVAALTDDTDALMELLAKPPAAMAAKLGRMDAGFSKPAGKPISQAPKPAAKVEPGGSNATPDIYDPKMSMADFQREMDKMLPVYLGGKRKVA